MNLYFWYYKGDIITIMIEVNYWDNITKSTEFVLFDNIKVVLLTINDPSLTNVIGYK